MAEFVKVAKASEIPAGSAKLVAVDGKEIAVFHIDRKFYALDNACTHVGGPLSEGFIDQLTVECPWHGAQFSLETGEALRAPARGPVNCYRVRQENDDVEVEV